MPESENIILHPVCLHDAEDIVRWRNQEFVKQRFIYQKDFTTESQRQWIKTKVASGEVVQFIIEYKKDYKRIGSVYLRDIDYSNRKAEYGIFLGEKDYLGKGIGCETAGLVLDYAFHTMKLNKIFLRVLADNVRAIKSYEKAGFKTEECSKQEVMVQGEYKDIIFMGICVAEYKRIITI